MEKISETTASHDTGCRGVINGFIAYTVEWFIREIIHSQFLAAGARILLARAETCRDLDLDHQFVNATFSRGELCFSASPKYPEGYNMSLKWKIQRMIGTVVIKSGQLQVHVEIRNGLDWAALTGNPMSICNIPVATTLSNSSLLHYWTCETCRIISFY